MKTHVHMSSDAGTATTVTDAHNIVETSLMFNPNVLNSDLRQQTSNKCYTDFTKKRAASRGNPFKRGFYAMHPVMEGEV